MALKSQTDYADFAALDMRVGKVTKVEDAQTKKPTYRITVDFGSEIGVHVTCGAYRNYAPNSLIGRQIIGVMNLGSRKMGPEVSEFLMLGVPNVAGETIYLMPEQNVELGMEVF